MEYNENRPRKKVTKKQFRQRQFGALAVIAFIVLMLFVLLANACTKKDDSETTPDDKPTATTTAAAVTTIAVPETTVPVTTVSPLAAKVQLSKREMFIDVGDTDVAIIQAYPDENTGEPNEVWRSMDPSVATVNNYGYVTGVAKGETYIILSFSNHPEIEIAIRVSVAGGADDPVATEAVSPVAALPDDTTTVAAPL